ncbi:MAG: 30S ribosomal protein S17 [bacterium]|jgi:small subunit ribosomal protein S17|nr:30S ribosomal protein S17 [bacterium]MBK7045214.1 30S ribosomal protein S17 [bacterium]MBK7187852.1 30S ribosomal protein S17 [bacterium]MBK7672310.1 30S ribosomal protein S17 [bacterium]MBK7768980.1 30S ribosomal protein S17 [bacterium]
MANTERNLRAVRIGRVVSSKMDKTVVVTVSRRFPHPLYKRIITRTTRLVAHDEANECNEGDVVKVMAIRPLSKTKRWRVAEIMEKAK